MKSILKEATDNFESKLSCDDACTSLDKMLPTTVRISGQYLTSKQVAADKYITYPYTLWDPLTQYNTFFAKTVLNCPLCLADGASSNVLF